MSDLQEGKQKHFVILGYIIMFASLVGGGMAQNVVIMAIGFIIGALIMFEGPRRD